MWGVPFEDPSDADVAEIVKQHDSQFHVYGHPHLDNTANASPPKYTHPELADIVKTFADVFSEKLPSGLPISRPTDHAINIIPGHTPPRHVLYRIPDSLRAELKQQIDTLLAAGHI